MNTDKRLRNQVLHQRKLLIGLLLAAILAVDAAVGAAVFDHRHDARWPDFLVDLWGALALSQTALVAIWAGFGRSYVAIRVATLMGTAVGWGALLVSSLEWFGSAPWSEMAFSVWTSTLSCQALMICLPLGLARLSGFGIASPGDNAGRAGPLRRFQFSIANLLAWTTAVAVILGFVSCLREPFRQAAKASGGISWVPLSKFCFGQAVVGLAVLWGALGTGRRGWRAAALVGAFVAAIFVHDRWADMTIDSVSRYGQLCLLDAALIFGPLWVFRVAGYRVIVGRG